MSLHATYTRDEILAGLGHWTLKSRPECREGTLEIPARKLDVFFVTLQKSEDEYSPTTRYEDFAIDERTFHGQSRSTTSDSSPTGRRYIEHVQRGYVPLLFVREKRTEPNGLLRRDGSPRRRGR